MFTSYRGICPIYTYIVYCFMLLMQSWIKLIELSLLCVNSSYLDVTPVHRMCGRLPFIGLRSCFFFSHLVLDMTQVFVTL